LGTELVQLVVGSDRKILSVHKKLLCSVSEFFDKALNGRFAEASSNQMELPEDTPSIVSMFISWLYTRDLKFDLYECDTSLGVTTLIDLYVFADAKRCNALKNKAMDTLQDGLYSCHLVLDLYQVEFVFEKTCTNDESPIRCFLVEAIAHRLHEGLWEVEDVSNLFRSHPEVLSDYLRL
jgi:BTB/POZ domain-containing protein